MQEFPRPLTFQELLFRLQTFWAGQGCVLQQPYDVEVGAGTMSPETFLRVLGPKPIKIAYAQPSRRPADGRYGDNPNRLYKHTQFQVILKYADKLPDVQALYLKSLEAIGIDLRRHDIKFEEDNWESPTLGAWGVGWQVMLDGLEITQFTYFQQCGGLDLDPISAEITYGLERIAAFLQDVDSIYDVVWARDLDSGSATTYGDVRHLEELQFSVYNFETADVEKLWEHLRLYESECQALLDRWSAQTDDGESKAKADSSAALRNDNQEKLRDDNQEKLRNDSKEELRDEKKGVAHNGAGRFPLLPAFDLCLKCSHLFNLLDARGAISVTERVGVIARIRNLAVGVAKAYAAQQEAAVAHA